MNRLWVAAAVVAANAAVAVVVALGLMFYALVAVLAVLVAIVVFQRPQRGLLLLAAGLPFDGLRIPIGVPDWTSNWVEGMVVLTLVAALVARPGLARPRHGAGVAGLGARPDRAGPPRGRLAPHGRRLPGGGRA